VPIFVVVGVGCEADFCESGDRIVVRGAAVTEILRFASIVAHISLIFFYHCSISFFALPSSRIASGGKGSAWRGPGCLKKINGLVVPHSEAATAGAVTVSVFASTRVLIEGFEIMSVWLAADAVAFGFWSVGMTTGFSVLVGSD
jgi:hypothetical protein